MKYLIVLICLMASLFSNAQKLSFPEFISLHTLSEEKVTTFLKGKGYTVARDSKESDVRTLMYGSQVMENGKAATRIVSVTSFGGWKNLTFMYGLFDKKEVDELVGWLTKNGFKFMGKKSGGGPKQMQSTYTKDKKTIFLNETAYEGKSTLYQFVLHDSHYK